jgi:beta-glucosidase
VIDAQAPRRGCPLLGAQIAVLLKNDGGLLPLDAAVGSIVLIGQSTFVDEALPRRRWLLQGDAAVHGAPAGPAVRDVLRDLGSAATVAK